MEAFILFNFYWGAGSGLGLGAGVGNLTSILIFEFSCGDVAFFIVNHHAPKPTSINNTITISTVLAPESPFWLSIQFLVRDNQ